MSSPEFLGFGQYAAVVAGEAWWQDRRAFSLLLLADQALNVIFALTARWPEAIDRRPHAVLLSVLPTFSNVLLDLGHGAELAPRGVVTALQVAGIGVQVLAKLSLGRSFGIVPANRGVQVRGLYRLVRHPTYLGYGLAQLGTMLGVASVRNVAVVLSLYALLAVRGVLEERVLRRDPRYVAYADDVPWRVIPFVW